jgi:hypothetical protein
MKNLNGWLRLWIFCSCLWVIGSTYFFPKHFAEQLNFPPLLALVSLSEETVKVVSTESTLKNTAFTVAGMSESLYFEPDTPNELREKAIEEIEKAVEIESDRIATKNLINYLKLFFAFPFFSFVLGISIYWVRLGFKNPSN